MANKVKLKDWIEYLLSRVGIDLYVWGGNGQTLIILLPKLCEMEKDGHTDKEALTNVDRVLTLLQKRLLAQVDIYSIRCEDCSGLSIRFLLDNKIIKSDMTANALWEYIVGTEKTKAHGKRVALKDVKAGDYLFQGSDTRKWHVGYAVSETRAVESKNHDVGVVKTVISERGWTYAARPNWYEGVEPTPTPIITRELYYTNPMMRGYDVEIVQERLNELGYNCGEVDGIFGKKTEIAVKNFQADRGLIVDGIVGKYTVQALGFDWEG